MPTEEGNGYPTGVVLPGLVNINLTKPETILYEDDCVFLRNTETTITGEFRIPEIKIPTDWDPRTLVSGRTQLDVYDLLKTPDGKMTRKRFKKLLMAHGIRRDAAENFCNLVVSHKGSYIWSWTSFKTLGYKAIMF